MEGMVRCGCLCTTSGFVRASLPEPSLEQAESDRFRRQSIRHSVVFYSLSHHDALDTGKEIKVLRRLPFAA